MREHEALSLEHAKHLRILQFVTNLLVLEVLQRWILELVVGVHGNQEVRHFDEQGHLLFCKGRVT